MHKLSATASSDDPLIRDEPSQAALGFHGGHRFEHRARRRSGQAAFYMLGLLSAALSACGPSSSKSAATTSTGPVQGEQVTVIVDRNEGGDASAMRIEEMKWGRLVHVFDVEDDDGDPLTPRVKSAVARQRDFLIAESVITNGVDYVLETNPFTEQVELTILADADSEELEPGSNETGEERYGRLLREATDSLVFVTPTGLDATFLPPFPLIPRNAALSIRFSDLLDPTTISDQTVRVFTGNPPVASFGARVVADPNYGAFVNVGGALEFRPTRVLVDFTVSESEATQVSAVVNSVGLPASVSNSFVNAVVRVPTRLDASVGQFQLLRNLSGHTLDFSGSSPSQSTATLDVVRAFRSGRSDQGADNQDANNGFLLDLDAPRILGSQPIEQVTQPVDDPSETNPMVLLAAFQFDVEDCAQTPRAGNILRMVGSAFPAVFAEVTRQAAAPQNGVASDVQVRVLSIPPGEDLAAILADFVSAPTGEFQSIFEPGLGIVPECFFQISPQPLQPPTSLIDTTPQFKVRFSEPMDPASITPHDNFRLDRVSSAFPGPLPKDTVVGQMGFSPDLREFRYTPLTPLDHVSSSGGSTADTYFLNIVGGPNGVNDLAGNGLATALPADIQVTVDNTEPTIRTGGFVYTFDEIDEDKNSIDPNTLIAEVRGQFSRDLVRGVILPRPVSRDARTIDRTTPLYSIMTQTSGSIITPLAPLGSRMMTVWRYADAGFQVLDEATANMDVEGLSFAPSGGQVSSDFFELFEISLSHSVRQPDEWPIPIFLGNGGLAQFPGSGLLESFALNFLKDPDNQLKIVHPRSKGYLLTPSQVFTATTGTRLMPFPLNRGIPLEQFQYYTWRDTAILGTGGVAGFGADIKALALVGLICDVTNPTIYTPGKVRSLGLPLLMEFKCFPDDVAVGLNGLDTSFALASEPRPIFRVFSTGGFNSKGAPITKNPDAQNKATGGFSPPSGVVTPGDDNTVMIGQLDLVVRVSRVHTIWNETGLGTSGTPGFPAYLAPVLEPRLDTLPSGTSVSVAFRGATAVTKLDPMTSDIDDATKYDAYGDPLVIRTVATPTCGDIDPPDVEMADIQVTFLDNDATWHANLTDLDGAQWIQARVTFVSNAATLLTPELSTFAIAYFQ